MDRTPLIAGNWKMYKTSGEAAVLVQDLELLIEEIEGVEIAVCPPFTALRSVSVVLELDRAGIALGAQNVYWEDEGAYTGEISPRMLTEFRTKYVIIGHSERREYFGETDETVNRKMHAVLGHGMTPIVCVGETLATRESGQTDAFVREQVRAGLTGLTAEQASALVVAYEPIWAIGTGRTPTPEDANDVCRAIRATVGAMYGAPAAIALRVLYGGSVKPENCRMFFSEPDIDGALVGGAALDARSFADIIEGAVP